MKLANIAHNSSVWCWGQLKSAVQLRRKLGETAVTDFLLLNLCATGNKSIIIEDFSQNEEAKNGADWEWWFVDSAGYSLPFRVQAKVIESNGSRPFQTLFKQLHYSGKKGLKRGHQTNRLIRRAGIDRMYPVYCLYTYFDNLFSPASTTCTMYPNDVESFGVTIVGAQEINQTSSNRLLDFFEHAHAFECIFMHCNTLLDIEEYIRIRWKRTKTLPYSSSYIRPPQLANPYANYLINRAMDGDRVNDMIISDIVLPNNVSRVTVFYFPQMGNENALANE